MSFRISDDIMNEMLNNENLKDEDRKKLLKLKDISEKTDARDKKLMNERLEAYKERRK